MPNTCKACNSMIPKGHKNQKSSTVSAVNEVIHTSLGRAVLWQTAMQITDLLQRVHAGDQQAFHAVIPLVYDELKKLAAGNLRREGKGQPLDTTALVHEAFLRLAHGQHPSYEDQSHFYSIAS